MLRNQALVELARENVEQHQGILGQVRQLEGQGGGSIGDVRQAEARLAEAQNALAVALGHLRDAEAVYLAVVGMAAVDLEEGVSPVVAVPESPDAAATVASVSSPTVQIADADIDVAEAELRGSRAGYYPNLDLELGASAGNDLDGVEGKDVSAQALVVLRYNLFRGGGDIAREREAFLRIKEAREGLRVAQRDAERGARVAYNALLTAGSRLEALRAAVEAQRATRDIYAQQFDLGPARPARSARCRERAVPGPQQPGHRDLHRDVRRLPGARGDRHDAGHARHRSPEGGDQHLSPAEAARVPAAPVNTRQ